MVINDEEQDRENGTKCSTWRTKGGGPGYWVGDGCSPASAPQTDRVIVGVPGGRLSGATD